MADSSATQSRPTSQNNGVGNIPRKPLRQGISSSADHSTPVTPSIEVDQSESILDYTNYASNVVDQPIQEVSFS